MFHKASILCAHNAVDKAAADERPSGAGASPAMRSRPGFIWKGNAGDTV